MDGRTGSGVHSGGCGELDLSISKSSLDRNENNGGMCLNTLLNTPRSSISSLLSLSNLRLWENPMTASAISAAAAMTHLMDINNSGAFCSPTYGGKSCESLDGQSLDRHRPVNGLMCVICGRVARDRCELEHHMLTHSMEKPYQCVKCDKTFKNLRNQQSHQFLFHNITDGLTPNRMQGLLMASKKRKVKSNSNTESNSNDDEPLDVTMPEMKKKRMCDVMNDERCDDKTLTVINSINTTAFPCTSCHKTFATEVDLKAHLMRHLTQHPFVCLACGKGFKYEHSLNFHIKSYHNSNVNNNNSSGTTNTNTTTTTTTNNNNNNNNKINNNNNDSNNNIGNEKKSSVNSSMKSNEVITETKKEILENTHSDNYDSETSIDEIGSDDEEIEIKNEIEIENENDNDFIDYGSSGGQTNITARSIQIKSEKILITLLEGIHPVTEQSYILYKCCLCGFAFPSLEPITLHMQTSHLNSNKEFTCDKCGAHFKWRSELNLHEQLHKAMNSSGNESGSGGSGTGSGTGNSNAFVVTSNEFGQSCVSPSNDNNEDCNTNNCDDNKYKSLHKSNKSTISPNKSTKNVALTDSHNSNSSLKKEMSSSSQMSLSQKFTSAIGDIEETAPGQFKCRFCDKTFDRIFSVHRHERVHTGFKPCICKTCGRGFSEKRNLRHHIIRFHSDGSGRELLKRNRKDKNNSESNCKRKLATNLKKAALKILNNGNESFDKNLIIDDSNNKKDNIIDTDNDNDIINDESNNIKIDTSSECTNNNKNNITANNSSSSSRRRKGKPSKKIIASTEELSPISAEELSPIENNENHDNDETQCSNKSREERDTNSSSEINPNDFLETKFRCHGAFFSSYNPRLGVVEKPVKRTEACRPLLGPDGKYLYPCTYCNKTFCSLSDLNRHMNFHEDVRPFKCEYCNYQSRTNSQLKVHMMRHAGIKQYLCQVCNYNGVTQSDLNRHCKTRSHALRSANICPLCALGFSTRTLLDDHIIKFHEASDGVCNTSLDSKSKLSKQQNQIDIIEHNNNDYSFSVKQILN